MLGEEPSSGFQRLLGYRLVEWRPDYAVVALEIKPEHLNRSGVVHGGVFSLLIDTACGFSATYCPKEGRVRRVFALSMTTSFTGKVKAGEIKAIGHKKGGGYRIITCTAEVLDQDGKLVSIGQGTYRYQNGSEEKEGVPL